MAPGSYTPVVYQASGLHDSSNDAKPQIRVEAMRVRQRAPTYEETTSWQLTHLAWSVVRVHVYERQWGLVPSFTKPQMTPDHFIMFNARCVAHHKCACGVYVLSDNTVSVCSSCADPTLCASVQRSGACSSPIDALCCATGAFRGASVASRAACVLLIDSIACSYYEWQQVDKKEKQPYYFFQTDRVMKVRTHYSTAKAMEGRHRAAPKTCAVSLLDCTTRGRATTARRCTASRSSRQTQRRTFSGSTRACRCLLLV